MSTQTARRGSDLPELDTPVASDENELTRRGFRNLVARILVKAR